MAKSQHPLCRYIRYLRVPSLIRVALSNTRRIWALGPLAESPHSAELLQLSSYLHFLLQTWSLVPVKISGGPQSAAVILGCALCSAYCKMDHTHLFVWKVKVVKDL